MRSNPSLGAVAAQALINAEAGVGALRLDGIIGQQTLASFSRLSSDKKKGVEVAVSRYPGVLDALNEKPQAGWIKHSEAVAMADAISSRLGIPVSYLQFVLTIEPEASKIMGERYVNAAHKGKWYRGLAQMGKDAWSDAVRSASDYGAPELLGTSWETHYANPQLNLLAAAVYYKVNLRYVKQKYKKFNGLWDDRVAFMAHNLGHTAVGAAIKTGAPTALNDGQSSQAQASNRAAAKALMVA